MSNIVVLSGSVRKGGNTELLVQAFVDGAKKNNSVEVISVADYKVNPCIGCNTCFICQFQIGISWKSGKYKSDDRHYDGKYSCIWNYLLFCYIAARG